MNKNRPYVCRYLITTYTLSEMSLSFCIVFALNNTVNGTFCFPQPNGSKGGHVQSQSRVTFRITLARVGRGNWSYDVTNSDWPVQTGCNIRNFVRVPCFVSLVSCDQSVVIPRHLSISHGHCNRYPPLPVRCDQKERNGWQNDATGA